MIQDRRGETAVQPPRVTAVLRLRMEPADVLVALELERIALEDEYFVKRKLYPNVDFYSGLIYQAMGFPIEMFTVLFAIPRTAGWLAHWKELLEQDQKIARLEEKLVKKNEVVAELMEAHVQLKKELGEL